MDFADAMKLVLGGITVTRAAWASKLLPRIRMVDGIVMEEDEVAVGPYRPENNDMTANDWRPVNTVPTSQLSLAGLLGEDQRQGAG